MIYRERLYSREVRTVICKGQHSVSAMSRVTELSSVHPAGIEPPLSRLANYIVVVYDR